MTSKTFTKPISALDARFEAQKLAFAPLVFQCVRVALKWGLLEQIDQTPGGCTVAMLATARNCSEYAVSVLMETCLSAGVVSLVDDHYLLEKTGHFVLHDEMTRVNINFAHEICYRGMFELEAALRDGRPAGLSSLGDWEHIYRGLKDLNGPQREAWFEFDHHYSDSAFALVLPLVFAKPPARLMDIGANTGKWARHCLAHDADVRLSLVDLPEQLAVARANLADHHARIDFCPVDMLESTAEFPAGQDVVWMSQFLSCFSAETNTSIFERARRALNPGGCVYVLDTFWDRQRFEVAAYCVINTSPYFAALANGTSKMYQSREYIEFAAKAGLRLTDIRDGIGLSHSLLRFEAA